MVNVSTGNLTLQHPVCGWGGKGPGIQLTLAFNSQSSRSSALGAKWIHSYLWQVVGTNPAVVIAGDGSETSYYLVGGLYVAPAGVYDTLVLNPDGTWTLTLKGGVQYRFRTDGKLGSIVDLNGNTVSCAYTGSNLTSVADPAGRILQLGYTSGKLTSITDAEGRVWSLNFDASNRVIKVNDPTLSGNTYFTQFGYGANNNVTSITNRLNKAWQYAYSSNDFSSMTDPGTKVWSLAYGAPGNPGFGPAPGPGGWPTNVTVVAAITDPTSRVVKFGLNALGELIASRDPAANQAVLTYDSSHNVSSRELPSGLTWEYLWDVRGNRLSETDPTGAQSHWTYDAGDRVLTETDPNGAVTQFAYDARGNQTSVTDPSGRTSLTTFNADGTPSSSIDPAGKITGFGYDTYGNQTSITDPRGKVTQFAFGTTGHTLQTSRTDALNRTTSYSHDA